MAHLDHARETVGVRRLGLGDDDCVPSMPDELADVSRYPVLLRALVDEGWSHDDLQALT